MSVKLGGGGRETPVVGFALVTPLLGGLCVLASTMTLIPAFAGHLGNDATNPLVRLVTSPFVHGSRRDR